MINTGYLSRIGLSQTESNASAPLEVGTILIWTTDTAPSGWLLCDGSAVSQTTYASLYSSIGLAYGDPGSGNFNLPDLRGRFPLGKDNMGGTSANRVTDVQADSLGGNGGAETHTLIVDEMPSHNHSNGAPTGSWAGIYSNINNTGNTGSKGNDEPHNNLNPYLTLNYIIKV